MCVSVCVYPSSCVCLCVCIHAHVCLCVCIDAHVYVCVYIRKRTYRDRGRVKPQRFLFPLSFSLFVQGEEPGEEPEGGEGEGKGLEKREPGRRGDGEKGETDTHTPIIIRNL